MNAWNWGDFVYPNQESVRREAAAVGRPWLPLSQRARDALTIAVAVATVVGVLWGTGASLLSGLENRLIDRIDRLERDMERDMAEGFEQSHQRMDRIERRMDGRMDRIESDIDGIESDVDQIESDVDAIEKHLLRIGSAIESERTPAAVTPAVAAPDRDVSTAVDVGSVNPTTNPVSGEIRSPNLE